jgi:hypothetical protein
MQNIRGRLQRLGSQFDAELKSARNVTRPQRDTRHLCLLRGERDALQDILDDLTPAKGAANGWQDIQREFDAAVCRLERSQQHWQAHGTARQARDDDGCEKVARDVPCRHRKCHPARLEK